jgi:hypothetical protein
LRAVALLGVFSFAGACALAPEAKPSAFPPTTAQATPASFTAWEEERLAELATVDPRLSFRMRIEPSEADSRRAVLGAILAEDEGLRVVGQRADLFSFDGRARELDRIAARVASAPPVGADAKEVLLLTRLVAEERARVDEERRLPSSASALVRGVIATWTAPASMAELKERDAWLAARLDEVSASMKGGSIRAVEVTELEDALDPLERLAEPSGFPRAQGALARLRVALGAAHAASGIGMGWAALHDRLAVHLGVTEPEASLRAELARTEARLREEATAEVSNLPEPRARDVLRAAGRVLVDDVSSAAPRYEAEMSNSRVRTFLPPPERALVCSCLGAIATGRTDAEATSRLVATHDVVVLAVWAAAIHLDHVDPDEAPQRRAMLGEIAPEGMGRLVRFAAARPVACVAAARMAALLGDGGVIERQARAKRWLAFGDAPLDVVAREMAWKL